MLAIETCPIARAYPQVRVLMPSHTSGDPGFYAKKRAREAELDRELTTEEFLSGHYEASDAPTASGTSIFDPVLCEIA